MLILGTHRLPQIEMETVHPIPLVYSFTEYIRKPILTKIEQ